MSSDLTLVEFDPNASNHMLPQSIAASELLTYQLAPRGRLTVL
jgi:hypothetical protein